MRVSIAWTIFRKELTETLRDRRTLLMMIGLPVLLYPLVLIGFSKLQESESAAREERPSTVVVLGVPPATLEGPAGGTTGLVLREWTAIAPALRRAFEAGALGPEHDDPIVDAVRAAVAAREIDAALVAWPGFERAAADDGLARVSLYYDSVNQDSLKAKERAEAGLEALRARLVEVRERRRDLPSGFAAALQVSPHNVADRARRSGQILGTILPFMLIALSLLGGFYPAIDLTAGEKERGTMQTLLCAPLAPAEIIVGKFLAVWAIALMAALANVVSLGATLMRVMPGGDFSAPFSAYALAFVMLVPVTFTIAAAFLAVAVFARDFKDGQNFLTPVYMVLGIPAGITMLPGVTLTAWTAFVPIVNIALLIKALLLGEARGELVFLALLSSAAWAALAVLFAARVFEREQLLVGGGEPLSRVLRPERRPGGQPTPALVVTAFCGLLVLAFYGSLLLQGRSVLAVLLVTELGFFLLPTLALVFGFGFPVRDTLALRLPPPLALVASVVVGLSAWTVGAGLLVRLLPPPDSLARGLERILLLDGHDAPLWAIWLVVGVTPAVCEELFFRGFALSGLRRLGAWPAVAGSALMFGLAHASIYRLLPTLFLGLVFGHLAWRTRSVGCSLVAHAVNNGLMATLVAVPAAAAWLGIGGQAFLSWNVIAVGSVALAAGLALLQAATRAPAHGRPEP